MSKTSLKRSRQGVVGPRFLVTASLIVVVLASGLAFLRQRQLQADINESEELVTGTTSDDPTPSDTATETPTSSPSPTSTESASSTDEPGEMPSSGSTGVGPAGQIPTGNTTSSLGGGPSTTGPSGQGSTQTNSVSGTTQKPPSGITSSSSTTLNNNDTTVKNNRKPTSGGKTVSDQTPIPVELNVSDAELSQLPVATKQALERAIRLAESRESIRTILSQLIKYVLNGQLSGEALTKFINAAEIIPRYPNSSVDGYLYVISYYFRILGRIY